MHHNHISTVSKDQYHIKTRLLQGRTGIKKKMLRFPISWPCNNPEQQNYYHEGDLLYK